MTTTSSMLKTYPQDLDGVDKAKLTACIEACIECAQACTACADACLGEAAVDQLRKCIRTCLDCSDICEVTGRVLSRHTGYDANLTRTVLETCAITCKSCADECEGHATHHEHCRVCGEVCRRCERACRELIGSLG
ncbi:four-helix bundle copper-binding protein [Mycobacterium sp. WUMAC-067]|nr:MULTISPECIES: four-helix bundle copper-binding protein [unclassified Mycobacterium]MCA2245844.1 four-helix bundle copper-binding protein [Mycobacterium sp. WUMAC-067]MCA2317357.1 four-helix bundle copper-binding protein [Mycobacterium sp. WUMAC-025]